MNDVGECVEDQSYTQSEINGYRCILSADGTADWIQQERKHTWDFESEDSGYCPKQDQCLVSSTGNMSETDPEHYYNDDPVQKPACINNSDYIEDHLCYNGEWVSRTRYLGLMFHRFGTNWHGYSAPWRTEWGWNPFTGVSDYYIHKPFTFYCDDAENVVNYFSISGQGSARNIFETESCLTPNGINFVKCANKLCVLKYKANQANPYVIGGESLLIATTLNTVPSESNVLDDLFKQDRNACNLLVGTGNFKFRRCPGTCQTPKSSCVYYSDGLNAVVYSPHDLQIDGYFELDPPEWNTLDEAFGVYVGLELQMEDFFDEMGRLIRSSLSPEEYEEIINHSVEYSRLYKYLEKNEGYGDEKAIYGLIEPMRTGTYIFFLFLDFDINICDALDHKITSICYQDGNNSIIFLHQSLEPYQEQDGLINLEGFIDYYWPDLTTRLRTGQIEEVQAASARSASTLGQPAQGFVDLMQIFGEWLFGS